MSDQPLKTTYAIIDADGFILRYGITLDVNVQNKIQNPVIERAVDLGGVRPNQRKQKVKIVDRQPVLVPMTQAEINERFPPRVSRPAAPRVSRPEFDEILGRIAVLETELATLKAARTP